MKKILTCIVIFASTLILTGQEINTGTLTGRLCVLKQKKDTLAKAYALYPGKKLFRIMKRMDRKIGKIQNSPEMKVKAGKISRMIESGIKAYEQQNPDSTVYYLRFLNDRGNLVFVKSDTAQLYQILSESYLNLGKIDSATTAIENYIRYGGYDFINIARLGAIMTSRNTDWHVYMDGMIRNFVNKSKNENITISLLLSMIEFNDVLARSLSYGYLQILPIERAYASDSINQKIFEQLFYISPGLKDNFEVATSRGFSIALLHSIYSNTSFFEQHFYIYARKLGFQFSEIGMFRFLFDMYLRKTRGTQFFDEVKGTRKDGSFGTLPRENADTVAKVMQFLKIEYKPAE